MFYSQALATYPRKVTVRMALESVFILHRGCTDALPVPSSAPWRCRTGSPKPTGLVATRAVEVLRKHTQVIFADWSVGGRKKKPRIAPTEPNLGAVLWR